MAIEQTDVARLKAVGAELGRIAAERKALIPERDELIRWYAPGPDHGG
jgi:hypothetical protein